MRDWVDVGHDVGVVVGGRNCGGQYITVSGSHVALNPLTLDSCVDIVDSRSVELTTTRV